MAVSVLLAALLAVLLQQNTTRQAGRLMQLGRWPGAVGRGKVGQAWAAVAHWADAYPTQQAQGRTGPLCSANCTRTWPSGNKGRRSSSAKAKLGQKRTPGADFQRAAFWAGWLQPAPSWKAAGACTAASRVSGRAGRGAACKRRSMQEAQVARRGAAGGPAQPEHARQQQSRTWKAARKDAPGRCP